MYSKHTSSMPGSLWTALALSLALAASVSAQASDTPAATTAPAPVTTAKPTAPSTDTLAAARNLIKDKNWAAAIQELERLQETSSADWHNLLGYSLRHARNPDLKMAQVHYEEALKIDPQHRGALEYSGELFLQLNKLPLAQERLEALNKVCPSGCEESNDLKEAISNYKAAGDKYTPAP
jgi:tetratricopeptide (TPR) repeat protein